MLLPITTFTTMPSELTPLLAVQACDSTDSSKTLYNESVGTTHSDSGSDVCVREVGQTHRNWVPDPDGEGRARTLIICFDGTGKLSKIDWMAKALMVASQEINMMMMYAKQHTQTLVYQLMI